MLAKSNTATGRLARGGRPSWAQGRATKLGAGTAAGRSLCAPPASCSLNSHYLTVTVPGGMRSRQSKPSNVFRNGL